MTIADATINVDVWTSVRSALVSAGLAVTNSSTSATTAASVLASYNDKTPSRPQVVIHPVVIDEGGWKYGSSQGRKFINVVVDCVHSNTLGVDQLIDGVTNTLKTNDISGIELVAVSMDTGFSSPGDNKVHLKSVTLTYDRE